MTRLDPRLLAAGLRLSVADLVTLWADHMPARLPVPLTCRTCGHCYTARAPLCPTAAAVRPLLRRRRHEAPPSALRALSDNQRRDLTTDSRLSTALPEEVHP